MEGEKGRVCVTGGTGYIASWLIMRLLDQGYHVHCTVRSDPGGKKDISYLTNLPGASTRLRIFTADLNSPESFTEAIEGCSGVFHVAHPVFLQTNEPEELVSKRTVAGIIGILKTCLNSKSVKRVIYTSSAATVVFQGQDREVLDESCWSDLSLTETEFKNVDNSYMVSKVKTEKAALEFAEEHGLDLVTVLPSVVFGPFLCPKIPISVSLGLSMIFGKEELYKYLTNAKLVHIDDLACAHIFLLKHSNCKGRFICSSDEIPITQLAELLSEKYPDLKIPTAEELNGVKQRFKKCSLTSNKLLNAGFEFRYGVEDMIDGAMQSCKEKGFL